MIGKIWNAVKDWGGKIWGKAKDITGRLTEGFKTGFQAVANAFRRFNPLSRPLELGEFHFADHNYTGPGTRMDLHPNAPPVNDIDNVSRIHDLEYGQALKIQDPIKRAQAIQAADKKAIEGYSKYPNESGYKAAIAGIAGKFGAEQALSIFKGRPSTFYP